MTFPFFLALVFPLVSISVRHFLQRQCGANSRLLGLTLSLMQLNPPSPLSRDGKFGERLGAAYLRCVEDFEG